MYRIILAFIALSLPLFSLSQIYTLDGKLGIGLTPIERLQVDGNMRIDGASFLYGSTLITGELELTDGLRMTPPTVDPMLSNLLLISPAGKVERISNAGLTDLIYNLDCKEELGLIGSPVWNHSPGRLFVTGGNCEFIPLVGIGTATPEYELDVLGKTRISKQSLFGSGSIANDAQVEIAPAANRTISLALSASSTCTGVLAKATGADDRAFVVQDALTGTDKFRVTGAGNVWATGVFVRLPEQFPDYVFEDDYELMSLSELENFIKQNKRLPKMPSADKVAENGLNLGETDRLLTEKVEELTLYILQMKKEIDALKSETEQLKVQLSK